MELVYLLIILIILLVLYISPTLNAMSRGHPNTGAIFILNLLLERFTAGRHTI